MTRSIHVAVFLFLISKMAMELPMYVAPLFPAYTRIEDIWGRADLLVPFLIAHTQLVPGKDV